MPGETWFLTLGQRRIELPPGEHVVGRSRDCDVVVRDATVSRAHAVVHVARGRVTVQDLGSSNGTLVNGQAVRAETQLSEGDQLRLGRVRMTLARAAAPAAAGDAACPACGSRLDAGAAACPRCGETLTGSRPLSRSEAVAMSEVMAVGETLARPARSLEDTLPPFPVAWQEPAAGGGEAAAGEEAAPGEEPFTVSPFEEPPPEALDDPSSPVAVARAAEEDSPPPRPAGAAAEEEPDGEPEVEPDEEPADAAAPAGEEAAAPPLFLPAAGFWARAAAFALDLAGPLLLALLVGVAVGGWSRAAGAVLGTVVGLAAWAAATVPGWRRRGDSPGKRLLGLRVCDLDGRPGIGGRAAWLRFGGYLLGIGTLGIGFLLAGLSAGRRGLHDRLAGSYVAVLPEPGGRRLL